jgi:hypothetical protein
VVFGKGFLRDVRRGDMEKEGERRKEGGRRKGEGEGRSTY